MPRSIVAAFHGCACRVFKELPDGVNEPVSLHHQYFRFFLKINFYFRTILDLQKNCDTRVHFYPMPGFLC